MIRILLCPVSKGYLIVINILSDTDKDSKNDQVMEVIYDGHDTGQDTPDSHDGGKVQRRLCSDEDHVGRRLEEDIADWKGC